MENNIRYEIYYNPYVGELAWIIVQVTPNEYDGESRCEVGREYSFTGALEYVQRWQEPKTHGYGVKVYG